MNPRRGADESASRSFTNLCLAGTYPNAVEYRFTATVGVEISANLCDAAVVSSNGASGVVQDNSTSAAPGDVVGAGALDFHLLASSPAVDAAPGTPDCTTDLDGQARPFGSAADLGADEYRP